MAEGVWSLKRATGELIDLPVNLDITLSPIVQSLSVVSPEARVGAFVDSSRIKLQSRRLNLFGKLSFASLSDARNAIADLGWMLSGGIIQLYPRETKQRYIRAILETFSATSAVGGLVWDIEAELLAPDGFWLDETLTTYITSCAVPASVRFQLAAGGGWDVWPTIELSAVGASVTNPRIDNLTRNRFVLYTGTLTSGQKLVLDPDAVTAKIGTSGVINAINIEWFNPLDRFALIPQNQQMRLSAESIGTGGSLVLKLSWRRRWL